MTKIEELKAKLRAGHELALDIQKELQLEYNKVFDADKELQRDIVKLESGGEYSFDVYGELVRYIHIDLDRFEDCQDQLQEYLSDNHCADVDFEHGTMQTNEGESILINDDGDIYLNGKCIIDRKEYLDESGDEDEAKRNALIESYMERTGYFPGVFRTDRHGNVFFVNTRS